MKRKSWDEYFLSITKEVATRSTCLKRQVGAIAVINKRIVATGYNGAPTGIQHCYDVGCLRESSESGSNLQNCRALHAEMNVVTQAASYGISLKGATLYCTNKPCSICAKLLINSGIVKIIYENDYNDSLSTSLLKEANIELIQFNNILQKEITSSAHFEGSIVITDPYCIFQTDPNFYIKNTEENPYKKFTTYLLKDDIYTYDSFELVNMADRSVLGEIYTESDKIGVFLLHEVLHHYPDFKRVINNYWGISCIKNFEGNIEILTHVEGKKKYISIEGRGNINFTTIVNKDKI